MIFMMATEIKLNTKDHETWLIMDIFVGLLVFP